MDPRVRDALIGAALIVPLGLGLLALGLWLQATRDTCCASLVEMLGAAIGVGQLLYVGPGVFVAVLFERRALALGMFLGGILVAVLNLIGSALRLGGW